MSFYEQLDNFRQGSRNSVQNGSSLNEFDQYMHVPRPVEKVLYKAMEEIYELGGGLILVVGNAGDGKSHMFSSLQSHIDPDFKPEIIDAFTFYNDASESCSPQYDSMYTLQKSLLQCAGSSYIEETTEKMVLAINLGMLDEFIHNEENQEVFPHILSAVHNVIPELGNYVSGDYDSNKIKVIDLSTYQIFEFVESDQPEQPIVVCSSFMTEALIKITQNSDDNPINAGYRGEVTTSGQYAYFLNYKFLCNSEIQSSIVSLVIEAIIKDHIVVSPREFFGFIYSILVYKNISERNRNLEALLPNLLFNGGENKILKALQKLDPLKTGNNEVDRKIEELMTCNEVPDEYVDVINNNSIIRLLNDNIHNGGQRLIDAVRFLVRYNYLIHYKSFNEDVNEFLTLLYKCFKEKQNYDIVNFYKLAENCILPSRSIYYDCASCVPLPFQSDNYKFVSPIRMSKDWHNTLNNIIYDHLMPNVFYPYIRLYWHVGDNDESVSLDVDYQMYQYLKSVDNGRLFRNNDPDRNIYYSNFVDKLVQFSQSDREIRMITRGQTAKLSYDNYLLEMNNNV